MRGKKTERLEKIERSAESSQAFVVGDTCRKESLDGRGRKERRFVTGKVGEKFEWYNRMYTEIGSFRLTNRRSKREGSESDMSVAPLNMIH